MSMCDPFFSTRWVEHEQDTTLQDPSSDPNSGFGVEVLSIPVIYLSLQVMIPSNYLPALGVIPKLPSFLNMNLATVSSSSEFGADRPRLKSKPMQIWKVPQGTYILSYCIYEYNNYNIYIEMNS